MEYLINNYCKMNKINICDINLFVLEPKKENFKIKNLIFYHGWSSSAENQLFRANIFASFGYRVFLPDAIFHGQRGHIDYDDKNTGAKYFVRAISQNIRESSQIISYIKENFKEKEIGVSGHSMGAISSGGIYAVNKDLNMAMIFNGIIDYDYIVDRAKKSIVSENEDKEFTEACDFLIKVNPIANMDKLKNRPLILFNGNEDNVINPDIEENAFKKLYKIYDNKELIKFKRFELTTHQLTTPMLEESIKIFKDL
ncbi:MAG: serine aminopeptidase domain-containing protein [Peptoniphilus lacrimalis]